MDKENIENTDSQEKITLTLREYILLKPIPVITIVVIVLCIVNYIFKSLEGEITTFDAYEKYGFFSYEAIINGKYYGLITATLVHGNLMHIFFNLYCILFLGIKIEKEIGYVKYFLFLITSAIAGTGLELLFSETTGIGISGVAYAFFGFLWITSKKHPNFLGFLKKEDIINAIAWLVLCIVMTYFGSWNIANYAHLGGFIWGILFAYAYIVKEKVILSIFLQIIQLGLSLTPVFYAPWNSTWIKVKAVQYIENNDTNSFENILSNNKDKLDDDDRFYLILGEMFLSKKDYNKAIEYYNKSQSIAKEIENKESDPKKKTIAKLKEIFIKERLAISYLSIKEQDKSINIYQELLKDPNSENKANYYYNLACAYSIKNNKEKAIFYLSEAIKLDKKNKELAIKDSDFSNIKDSKEFKELIN